MPLTNATLAALPLGYLTGEDLMGFCPAQLIIQRNLVLPGQPQDGCDLAYAEIEASLVNRYDIKTELAKDGSTVPDTRAKLLVKIASIIAVRNVVGAAANTGPQMDELFKWADKQLLAIRNAQANLPLAYPPPVDFTLPDGRPAQYFPGDEARLICSSFKYIG